MAGPGYPAWPPSTTRPLESFLGHAPSTGPHPLDTRAEPHGPAAAPDPRFLVPPGSLHGMGVPQLASNAAATPYAFADASPTDASSSSRKSGRAAHACESCRQRKSKCNEARPCLHCVRNNLTCVYRRPPPTPPKGHMALFAGAFDAFRAEVFSSFGAIQHEVDVFKMQVHSLESKLGHLDTGSSLSPRPSPPTQAASQAVPPPAALLPPPPPSSSPSSASSAAAAMRPVALPSPLGQYPPTVPSPSPSPSPPAAPAPDMYQDLALPAEHETGAHNLLTLWQSIRPFGTPDGSKSQHGNELMAAEMERGQLPLYGDVHRAPASGGPAPDAAQQPVGVPRACCVGAVPPDEVLPGGLVQAHGRLCLDQATVRRLFGSYCRNMHVLMPFVGLARVEQTMAAMFGADGYLRCAPLDAAARSPGLGKRKRGSPTALASPPAPPPPLLGIPRRSIDTAILLLVCALGRICEVRASLGDAIAQAADALAAHSADRGPPRNIDVVPGLAYFAYGASILGELHGGHSLLHVSANLLCGLYSGQLVRVEESYRWIHSAGTSIQILISQLGFPHQTPPNAIRIAFWSCLQMESDILAELRLPPSGISRLEDRMPYPDSTLGDRDSPHRDYEDEKVMLCFYAQIALRKILNKAHSQLYAVPPNGPRFQRHQVLAAAQSLAGQLEEWRATTQTMAQTHGHDGLSWSDDDAPSPDINVARLRGKYYGARYVILRVLLRQLLEGADLGVDEPPWAASAAGSSQSSPHSPASSNEPSGGQLVPYADHASVVALAHACVRAAVKSTLAFDGARAAHGRLVVTNIFGTAHAQFGNMLVLSAVTKSPLYSYMFPLAEHQPLMQRTIDFFRPLAQLSPGLAKDLGVLCQAQAMVAAG